jgi:hypothetical protein
MARSPARKEEELREPIPFGGTLSANRAYVVHFAKAVPIAGRRRFAGRVEHLSTGEFARFSSLRALLDFLARTGGG